MSLLSAENNQATKTQRKTACSGPNLGPENLLKTGLKRASLVTRKDWKKVKIFPLACKSQFYFRFWVIEPRFRAKGLRFVVVPPRREIEKKEGKRRRWEDVKTRRQEGKKARGEDVKI